jgi:hypothetical protein
MLSVTNKPFIMSVIMMNVVAPTKSITVLTTWSCVITFITCLECKLAHFTNN